MKEYKAKFEIYFDQYNLSGKPKSLDRVGKTN
jgi:hypothetical protein